MSKLMRAACHSSFATRNGALILVLMLAVSSHAGEHGRQEPAQSLSRSDKQQQQVDSSSRPEYVSGLKLADSEGIGQSGQLVVLEFNGARNVSYRGSVTIEHIDIQPFAIPDPPLRGREAEVIDRVLLMLKQAFDDVGVTFATERPDAPFAYSTVFVGGNDSSFRDYGAFFAVAEKVDVGNTDPADRGFVFSDYLVHGHTDIDTLSRHLGREVMLVTAHLLGYEKNALDARGGLLANVADSRTTYCHDWGSSQYESVTVTPGTNCFCVDGIWGEEVWTVWWANDTEVDEDHTWWGNNYTDPEYCRYFGSGTTTIDANNYDGDWSFMYWHTWDVTVHIPQPDLIVQDIWTTPANPEAGESATIHARIKNQGDGDGSAFNIRYYVDGSSIGTDRISFGLDAGDSNDESIGYTFQSGGSHSIKVFADSSYELSESNENNNERTENVTVTEPDLIIEDIWVTPSCPGVGESATIHARIKNQGGADASAFNIRYYVDGSSIGTDRISFGLDAGDSNNESIGYTFQSGESHSVKIFADSSYEVSESNENNNDRTENLTICEPDLIVQDIWTTPTNPGVDDPATIHARIKNQGGTDASAFNIRYYVDGSSIGTDRISFGLDAGDSNDESIGYTFQAIDTYSLKVVADSSAEVRESNEGNNERTEQVAVVGPDLIVQEISASPDPCEVGRPCELTVTSCNIGSVGTGLVSIDLDYFVDGIHIGSDSLSLGLDDGQCNDESINFTPPAQGEIEVCATIDPASEIEEEDESNNQRCENFDVVLRCPDLIVNDIWVTPDPLVAGQTGTIHANLCNTGDEDAIAWIDVEYSVDGIHVGDSVLLLGLFAGQCDEETDDFTVPAGANVTVCVTVDADDDVDECPDGGEDNNELQEEFPVAHADLVVESVWTEPEEPQEGEEYCIKGTVCNIGNATASAGALRNQEAFFYVDGAYEDKDDYDNVAPGACVTLTACGLTAPTQGNHTIMTRADANGEVVESNEANNDLTATMHVRQPPCSDLVVADIWVDPDPLVVARPGTITANLCNQGDKHALELMLRLDFYIDGVFLDSNYLAAGLLAGHCNEEPTTFTPDTSGTLQVCVVIDPEDQVANECPPDGEGNNELCEDFSVGRVPTRFRGNHFVDVTASKGTLVRLEAKLEEDVGLHDNIGGEPIYFELLGQPLPDDGVTLSDLTTSFFGVGSLYYVIPEDLDPGDYVVHVKYDGSSVYEPTQEQANLTVEERDWHLSPWSDPVGSSTRTPLVLVHGIHSEGHDAEARWDTLEAWIDAHPSAFGAFDVYTWVHDSTAAVGFDGDTGNAEDLADFVYGTLLANDHYPAGTRVLFVAHSRGGLVVRAFMNHEHQGDDVLGLITLGTPHHGSPLAVPDWVAYAWIDRFGLDILSLGCYDTIIDTEPTPGLGRLHRFDPDELGSLNLAWDNADNALADSTARLFPVTISNDGWMQTTPTDANQLSSSTDVTVFYGNPYKDMSGTLAYLNQTEQYHAKIAAFAAYDVLLLNNIDLLAVCGGQATAATTGLTPEHLGLSAVTVFQSQMSNTASGAAVYHANDGFVPLQSALLLDISGGLPFSTRTLGVVGTLDANIAARRLVGHHHIFNNADHGIGDHLDLLDTDNSLYWQTITDQIHSFAAGRIVVNPEPGALNASWTLTGPNTQIAGPGSLVIEDAVPGAYTIEWADVADWLSPDPNPDTRTLLAGGLLVFNGIYVQCHIDEDCPDNSVFCDGGEVCVDGVCVSAGDPCWPLACYEDSNRCGDCVGDEDCADTFYCNGTEACDAGRCESSGDPCIGTGLRCDEDLEDCVECFHDGECADDGVYCNGSEVCMDGFCASDGDPCTHLDQLCDEPNRRCCACFTSGDCNDNGVFCDGEEVCDDGCLCVSTGDPCLAAGLVCDEGREACVECLSDADCEDHLFCTGVDSCVDQACQSSGDPCIDDGLVCDEGNDACVVCMTDAECDDANPCTDDSCEPSTGCVFTPDDSNVCADGLYCNGEEECEAGACRDVEDPCVAQCDEENDRCVDCLVDEHCEDNGAYCDGDEVCVDGECESTGDPCEAGECCVEDCAECLPNPWASGRGALVYVGSFGGDSVALFDAGTGENLSPLVPRGIGGIDYANGLAVSPHTGNLVVASVETSSIKEYRKVAGDCTGEFVRDFVEGITSSGIAFGPDGKLYATDWRTHRVLRFDGETGEQDPGFAAAGCGLEGPNGVVFTAGGELLVVSEETGSIISFDTTTGETCEVVASGCGLDTPVGIAVLPNGHVLVANHDADSVVEFDLSIEDPAQRCVGDFVAPGTCGLSGPQGITIGPNGNVFVSSLGSDAILEFDGTDGSPANPCVFATGCGLEGPTYLAFGAACVDDASCSDGNACNGQETCDPAIGCQPGTALNCNDGNDCTTDSCNPAIGCVHVPIPGCGVDPCDGVNCDDDDECTTDSCEDGTCVYEPITCDDEDACTTDTCVDGACIFDPVVCDDGIYCNGAEECVDGGCESGIPPCDGPCCEALDRCEECPCTSDEECDDGNACNGLETCEERTCVDGTPLDCSDDDPCTEDSCDPISGCANVAIECPDDEQCIDGDCQRIWDLELSVNPTPSDPGQELPATLHQNASLVRIFVAVAPQTCDDVCPSDTCDGRCVPTPASVDCPRPCVFSEWSGSVEQGREQDNPLIVSMDSNKVITANFQTVDCTEDSDCDDGQFCNGAELCLDMTCQTGNSPCGVGDRCNEEQDCCETNVGAPCGACGEGSWVCVVIGTFGWVGLRLHGPRRRRPRRA